LLLPSCLATIRYISVKQASRPFFSPRCGISNGDRRTTTTFFAGYPICAIGSGISADNLLRKPPALLPTALHAIISRRIHIFSFTASAASTPPTSYW
jgi:hypothetical protein